MNNIPIQKSLPVPGQHSQRALLRNIVIFSTVTLAAGWIGHWLDVSMNNPPEQSLGKLLWLVLPLLTAVILRIFGGDGWSDAGLRPVLLNHLLWYVIALLIYPATAVLVCALGIAFGSMTLSPTFSVAALRSVALAALLPSFIKNIFEEFAWRGYLAPKLRLLALHDYMQHIIVGMVWGLWHIPYMLYFFHRAELEAATAQEITTLLPLAVLNLVAASFVYGELRIITGSVWIAVLLHTIGNILTEMLIPQGFIVISPGMAAWVSPAHQSILAMVTFLALGIVLRKWRQAKQPPHIATTVIGT